MKKVAAEEDCPIIALDSFIQATRDSGYKGTASAISELIDNSLQAGATRIDISIKPIEGPHPVQVEILDNGCGMDPFTLRQALRFGGSSRFGDRAGLGRYGMGLPNSSLSQARRVVVYTWQSPTKVKASAAPDNVLTSYLDVDEIATGGLKHVPVPRTVATPEGCRGQNGTLVVWERCDRLDNRRISTLERKLAAELGRRFRHFIWDDVRIAINGEAVEAVDPLFLNGKHVGAELFGEELSYEIAIDPEDRSKTSTVKVRFTELPVREWGALSNEEKSSRGISKGSGVSIVRAGREVDYGWFLMGEKRRENYDDWWRCEVQFEPVLDEAFGITHTKQQVRPQSSLAETLSSDLEEIARTLNSRARRAYNALKNAESFQEAAHLAEKGEAQLKPLPAKPEGKPAALMGQIKKQVPALRGAKKNDKQNSYSIVEQSLRGAEFFAVARDAKQLVLVVNPDHPFFKRVYKPLADSDTPRDKELKVALELLLLSAARSEAGAAARDVHAIAQFRADWSKALAAYLNSR